MNTRTIKKRIRFYTALLCVSLPLVFSSCFGPELDTITERIDNLESAVKAIEAKLKDKKFITNYQSITGGFVITFENEQPITITNGAQGAKGTDGVTWYPNPADSMWWYSNAGGSYKTEYRAIGVNGKDGANGKSLPAPKIDLDERGNGFWIVYEWNDKDSLIEVETNEPAPLIPYMVDKVQYVDLFIPRVDSTVHPPVIRYDSLALPRYVEAPNVIYFRGYGQLLPGGNIRLLDNLDFNFWILDTANIHSRWKKRQFTDTISITGLPGISTDSLVIVYASTKAISDSRMLKLIDSQKNENNFFRLGDDPFNEKVTGILTKSGTRATYSEDSYYSLMTVNPQLVPSSVKQGNILYYMQNDTVTSIAGYPINARYRPSISAPLYTLGGKAATATGDANKIYFRIDTTSPSHGLMFQNAGNVFDYYIKDTARPAATFISIPFDSMSFRTLNIDTPAYILVVNKLLMNGEIKIDTVVISTRDTVRDLKKYPMP